VTPRDTPTPSAAVAVNRRLTVAEVAMIRAALRVWTRLEIGVHDRLITAGHLEVDADPIIGDSAIEQLLAELAGDGVVVTVTRFDPHDGRRI